MVIPKFVPDPASHEDFSPTLPSFVEPEVSREVAELMEQLDVQAMRTSLIDLDSMDCLSSWNIRFDDAPAEDPKEQGLDSTFHNSMATIIQLNKVPAGQTLSRMLRPQRWAFAWRIDERCVAVTEACYRTPRAEQRAGDPELVRLICDAGIRAGIFEPSEAMNDHSTQIPREPERPAADIETPPVGPAGIFGMTADAVSQHIRRAANSGASARYPYGALALLLGGLLSAALLMASHHTATATHAEANRLQIQAENTMTQRLSSVLLNGDYGEVQAELDSFAALKYFDDGVVTNVRQRVVAIVGDLAGTRIGDPVPVTVERSARVFDLGGVGSAAKGQLLTWRASGLPTADYTTQRTVLAGGLVICMTAAVVGTALLIHDRRRRVTASFAV